MKTRRWYFGILLIVIIGITFSGCIGPYQQHGPYRHGPHGPMTSSGSSYWTSSSSSSTSDCPWRYQCPQAARSAVKLNYVQQTLDRLLEETVQGSGSHLAALAQLENCSLEEVPSFSFLLKNNLSDLLANTEIHEEEIQPQQFIVWTEQLLRKNQGSMVCIKRESL